jgi:hypothetical protein
MKSYITILTAGVLAFLVSGCGIAYESNRSQLLKSATVGDYGPRPPENYQDMEAGLVRSSLKDPDSAKFQFGAIYGDAIQSASFSPKAVLVWRSDVQVNAKNSYGGYAGFQPYHFAWRDGQIFAVAYPIVTEYGASDGVWQYLH